MGHRAAEEPRAEGAGGLAAGVAALVAVVVGRLGGRGGAVLQALREARTGLLELLVDPAGEEAVQFEDRGHADGGAADGQQHHQAEGEPGPQGARTGQPPYPRCHRPPRHGHRTAGFSTYPAPRTVWIMGSRPASTFLRRYEMYSSTTWAWPPKS